MRDILVSVIIPYYKKKKYIKKTLASVLNQTYKNIEVILIYDDEDKNDLNYIKKIVKNNRKIKIINNKKNLGPGLSRNKGIKNSKGQFIAFIDSDDTWKKNKIKYQLEKMLVYKFDFSHTTYSILDKNNKVKSRRIAYSYFGVKELIKSCNVGLSTVMINKKILKKLNFPPLATKEDFVLWIKILQSGNNLLGIKKNLTFWRKLENSQSSSLIQKLFDGFQVYYNYLDFNFFKSIFYLLILSINFLKK